eukprot:gene1821-biopygen1315
MGELPARLAELEPARQAQRPIACLCHHGARSLRVASFLQHHGFEHLANITGGIDAWSHESDPAPFSAGKGGVGLGLSICRQIAEAMGAQVTLFNRMDAGQVIGVDAVVAWEE